MRFSLDNLKLDGDVLNIPLFMADRTEGLIGLALEGKKAAAIACGGQNPGSPGRP